MQLGTYFQNLTLPLHPRLPSLVLPNLINILRSFNRMKVAYFILIILHSLVINQRIWRINTLHIACIITLGFHILQLLVNQFIRTIVENMTKESQITNYRFLPEILIKSPRLEEDIVDYHFDEHKHYYLD